MREIFRKKLGNMAGFLLAAAVILLIVAALAILGGAVMRVFGFEYSSVWSVILFFIIATILSLPVSIFAEALPKVLLKNFGMPRHTAAALYIVLDTLATAAGLFAVDFFMDSVTASARSVIAVSLMFAVWGVGDILGDGKES